MMLTTVPFQGFYCSIHDQNCDDAVLSTTQDNNGEALCAKLTSALTLYGVEWAAFRLKYVQAYLSALSEALDVPLKFESIESPRFYNYDTDRIFAEITPEALQALKDRIDPDLLADVARRRFTSYDGFISHYSPRLADWSEDMADWDHNQIGTLLQALFEQEEVEEIYLMDDARGNGDFDNWIYECATEKGKRLLKVYDWMRERKQ